MKRKYRLLSWFLLILLMPAIIMTFRQADGRADDRPAGEASGQDRITSQKSETMSEMFQGKVAEVIDAGRHFYVLVHTGKQKVWVAVPSFDGKPGDEVVVPPGLQKADFYSRMLNRKFKMIIFVGEIHQQP